MFQNIAQNPETQPASANIDQTANNTPEADNSKRPPSKNRLFVGEADFSFTKAFLQKHSHTTDCIIATEFEKEEFLVSTYENFPGNIRNINTLVEENKTLKVVFKCEVDATKPHEKFPNQKFNHIHFNFPYVNLSDTPDMLAGFFASASQHQNLGDSIHIVFLAPGQEKIEYQYKHYYNIWEITKTHNYVLQNVCEFNSIRYPGYSHRITRNDSSQTDYDNSMEYIFTKTAPEDIKIKQYAKLSERLWIDTTFELKEFGPQDELPSFIARVLPDHGDYDFGRTLFRLKVDYSPSDYDEMDDLGISGQADFNLGRSYLKRSLPQLAKIYFERAARKGYTDKPNYGRMFYTLGTLYPENEMGKKIENFEKAVENGCNNSQLLHDLCDFYFKKAGPQELRPQIKKKCAKMKKPLKQLSKRLKWLPKSFKEKLPKEEMQKLHLSFSRIYLVLEKYDKAILYYRKVHPNFVPTCNLSLDQDSKSDDLLRFVLSIKPPGYAKFITRIRFSDRINPAFLTWALNALTETSKDLPEFTLYFNIYGNSTTQVRTAFIRLFTTSLPGLEELYLHRTHHDPWIRDICHHITAGKVPKLKKLYCESNKGFRDAEKWIEYNKRLQKLTLNRISLLS